MWRLPPSTQSESPMTYPQPFSHDRVFFVSVFTLRIVAPMGGDEAVFMQFDEQYYMKNRLLIHLRSAMRIETVSSQRRPPDRGPRSSPTIAPARLAPQVVKVVVLINSAQLCACSRLLGGVLSRPADGVWTGALQSIECPTLRASPPPPTQMEFWSF
ncbi:hypothetical protein KC19_8G073100 [Ceratodon purpureus]|uniref:Uncharacterized protein n=1 Tax=Ceratodon purpureus TaxID=3225 RepID=A0A8T0GY67_CERPU|nr:hypothetical protein KC19_8G073100 [Ceratodon purpureus]